MNTKSFRLFVFSVLALVFLMSAVSAATITSDNFNTVNLTGWTATGWSNAAGTYAESTNTASSTLLKTISVSGFESIVVKYDRQLLTDWEAADSFDVSWSTDGVTFTSLENVVGNALDTLPSDAAFVSKTFNLPASVDNTANLRIRFSCNTSAADEFCRVDNFVVEGTATLIVPSEITAINAIGNPGSLDIRKIDFTNKGMQYGNFGKDDEWFTLDNIEVQIEVRNNGNDNVDDVEVSWGLYDTKTNQWIIDYDNEDEFNIKDGNKEFLTVSFNLNDDLDVDLEDLSDGNNYKFYVTASGTVDNSTAPKTAVSDFEQATIVVESDFVVLDNFQLPETTSCGSTVEVSADAWNIGDSDQDEVSVLITNKELGLEEEILVGDMDAFDNQKFSFNLKVPSNVTEKTYVMKFEVLNEDKDVYQNDYDDDYAEFSVPLIVKGGCTGSAAPATVTANLVSGGKAGQDLVVKATVTNTGSASSAYVLSASGQGQWASSYTVDPATLTLPAGQTGTATYTFKVNGDATGEQTFYMELVSGTQITRQPVSVTITPAGFFDSITGGAISGGNSWVWGLGVLNVILLIVIILVAMRVMRK